MEQKTKLTAEAGRQETTATREFDIPLELLFKAHVEPDIIGQWMGTTVVKFEDRKYGSYEFQTKDGQGKLLFQASGVFHEFIPNRKITRTFEMPNSPFGVQLEIVEFERLTDDTSKLTMHTIYESVAQRDQLLQYGMSQGMNMAHNRLQDIAKKLNSVS
jgi:uncharacterized protein YndB with AHSA1/START domain